MDDRFERKGHSALRHGRLSVTGWCHLLTTVTMDRTPWFNDPAVARTVSDLHRTHQLFGDAELIAWVLMPDHWHGVLRVGVKTSLPRAMNRFKTATAVMANRAMSRRGTLWARAFHDHSLRDEQQIHAAIGYVIANPVRAGLCAHSAAYPYWGGDDGWIERHVNRVPTG